MFWSGLLQTPKRIELAQRIVWINFWISDSWVFVFFGVQKVLLRDSLSTWRRSETLRRKTGWKKQERFVLDFSLRIANKIYLITKKIMLRKEPSHIDEKQLFQLNQETNNYEKKDLIICVFLLNFHLNFLQREGRQKLIS